jgi:hypothetical protein
LPEGADPIWSVAIVAVVMVVSSYLQTPDIGE